MKHERAREERAGQLVLAPYLRSLPGANDAALREQYIQHYYSLAYFFSTRDKENPDRIRAIAQREFPNMLSTLHMLFHTDDIGLITAVADILTRFLEYFGRWRERDALRLSVLAAIRPVSAQGGGMLTWEVYWREKSLGEQELEKGDWRAAVKRFQALLFAIEMLPEGEEIGPRSIPHITTLQRLARGLKVGGQLDEAATRLRQAQAITSELLEKEKKEGQKNPDLKRLHGSLLADYGDVLRDQGIYDAAQRAYDESLGIAREEKDRRNQAIILMQLHEKFYAQNPLQQAIALHQASRVLMTMADRWRVVEAKTPPQQGSFPYMVCEDLNETAAIQHSGVLFLEGEGEPPEITRLKRDLWSIAEDFGETGQWLANAMQLSWQAALPLLQVPTLAGVLGERHRIIVNDWQAAHQSSLISMVIKRALEILERVDFAPWVIRTDLAGPRVFPEYLYAASELINRAADIASESASLTHDNERRWRVFHQRVQQVIAEYPNRAVADEDARQAQDS